jgi:hypothetical protein
MPAPVSQNKYKEQVENNIILRVKMRTAFINACQALSSNSVGGLEDFEVKIDGVLLRYRRDDQFYIDDIPYDSCEAKLRKKGYDRLEKFMTIAIDRLNTQFNL